MVSKDLFQFLSKIPGRNRKNLFVLLDNDTRIIGLNGLYDDPNEQWSLQGQDINIEMATGATTQGARVAKEVFRNIFKFYGARGAISSIGRGVCVNSGQCEVFFGTTKTIEPSHSTLPVSQSYYTVYLRQPEPVNSPFYFLEEFSGPVWLTILCTLILFSVMMWAIVRLLHRFVAHAPSVTFADAVTENISAFSGQGFSIDSKSLTYRLFIFVALLWNLMMSISYSTNLVSYLCAQRVPMQYNGVMDLLKSREYSVCYNINDEIVKNALNLDDEVFKTFSNWINSPKCGKDPYFYKKRMCNDKIAVLMDKVSEQILLGIHIPNCTIITLKEKYMVTQNRIFIKSRSRYREQFNHVILRMQETGILKKVNKDIQKSTKIEEEVRKLTSVEQTHTSYIFFGYFFGIGLAILVFLVEILVHRLTRFMRAISHLKT